MRMKAKKYLRKQMRRKRNIKKSILNDEWDLEEYKQPGRVIKGPRESYKYTGVH